MLLLLLPGFLLVQILRVSTNPLEKILFLIGLSVSFAMFVPLVMNFTLPVFGVSDPLSVFPLTIAFSAILVALSVLAYRLGAFDFQVRTDDFKRVMNEIKSPAVSGQVSIIVLGIYGAFVVRIDLNSLVSLCAMLSIAVAVIILTVKRTSLNAIIRFHSSNRSRPAI